MQWDEQVKRNLRLLGLAILVLISTAVVFASLSLYHSLKKPLAAAATGMVEESDWDGRSRLNLLLIKFKTPEKVGTLFVLTLEPAERDVTILEIPPTILAEELGPEPLSSLTEWQRAVGHRLGISFDGYLLWDDAGEARLARVIGGPLHFSDLQKLVSLFGWLKIPSFLAEVKRSVTTNLSLWDIFKVARAAAGVRFDKVKEEVLDSEFFYQRGSSETFLRETFSEEGIVEERARILVLNGTGQAGLAAQAARLITHLGGYVLETANASRADYKESFLVVGERAPYTAKRLAKIFGITQYQERSAFAQDPLFGYFQRSDLVLILGLDKVDRL